MTQSNQYNAVRQRRIHSPLHACTSHSLADVSADNGRHNFRQDSQKIYLGGGWGALGAPFPPPPPLEGGSNGWLSFFHIFHAYSMTKPLALCRSVTVTVSLPGAGGGGGRLLLWLSAVLIPPPQISKLEPKFSDICIENINLWPLEPLFAAPRLNFGEGLQGPWPPRSKNFTGPVMLCSSMVCTVRKSTCSLPPPPPPACPRSSLPPKPAVVL